jgi:hypothetical protein
MSSSLRRRTSITVPRVTEQPIWLFTPEGERIWARDAWNPDYPDPARNDGVGTVFTTEHGGPKVWVIVERTDTTIRYAGVTADEAGTLEVAVEGEVPPVGAPMNVSVTYDLTALSAEGERSLADFDEHYEDEIATWQRDIHAAISERSSALVRIHDPAPAASLATAPSPATTATATAPKAR